MMENKLSTYSDSLYGYACRHPKAPFKMALANASGYVWRGLLLGLDAVNPVFIWSDIQAY